MSTQVDSDWFIEAYEEYINLSVSRYNQFGYKTELTLYPWLIASRHIGGKINLFLYSKS